MKRFILALILGAYSLSTQAELIDRGAGFIYDDVLDITWTQDAGMSGEVSWGQQKSWAASLTLYDPIRGVTHSDWRLPNMNVNGGSALVWCDRATEVACRNNELGYMYHYNGVTPTSPGVFKNLTGTWYWSSTSFNDGWATSFGFHDGANLRSGTSAFHRGWAVMDGDVGAVPVRAAACLGFDSPLNDGAVTVKKNRVLPHKGRLIDENGQPIDDLGIVAPPVVQVIFDAVVDPTAQDVTSDALSNGAGAEGNQFEFIDSQWQFNLSTKNYSAAGTYTVTMESGDSSEYTIDPTCASQFVIH